MNMPDLLFGNLASLVLEPIHLPSARFPLRSDRGFEFRLRQAGRKSSHEEFESRSSWFGRFFRSCRTVLLRGSCRNLKHASCGLASRLRHVETSGGF